MLHLILGNIFKMQKRLMEGDLEFLLSEFKKDAYMAWIVDGGGGGVDRSV